MEVINFKALKTYYPDISNIISVIKSLTSQGEYPHVRKFEGRDTAIIISRCFPGMSFAQSAAGWYVIKVDSPTWDQIESVLLVSISGAARTLLRSAYLAEKITLLELHRILLTASEIIKIQDSDLDESNIITYQIMLKALLLVKSNDIEIVDGCVLTDCDRVELPITTIVDMSTGVSVSAPSDAEQKKTLDGIEVSAGDPILKKDVGGRVSLCVFGSETGRLNNCESNVEYVERTEKNITEKNAKIE